MRVWSWNARGMTGSKVADIEHVEENPAHKDITLPQVIAVQETWLSLGLTVPPLTGFTWMGRPTARKGKKRAMGGTGFYVHEDIADLTTIKDADNDRIAVLEYKTRSSITYLVNVYAPTADQTEETKTFFRELTDVVHKYSALGTCILLGDLNARLGNTSSVIGKHNEAITNNNEPHVREMLLETDMVALNGRNPCDEVEYTYSQTNGPEKESSKSVIDYVCVPADQVDDCSFRVLAERAESDHYIVEATLTKIAVANRSQAGRVNPKVGKKVSRPNFHLLIHGHEDRIDEYHAACQAEFDDYQDEFAEYLADADADKQEVVNKMHLSIVSRIHNAVAKGVQHTDSFVGTTGKARRHYKWHDKQVARLKAQREVLRRKVIIDTASLDESDASPEKLKQVFAEYQAKCKEVQTTIKRKKQKLETRWQTQLMDDQVENPKRFWDNLKRLRGGNGATSTQVKSLIDPTTGETVTGNVEIRKAFRDAANVLYNEKGDETKFDEQHYAEQRQRYEEITDNIDAECSANMSEAKANEWYNQPITVDEVSAAASELEYHKAADRENIRSEFFIFADEIVHSALTDMCNYIMDHGVAPAGWQTGSITMLPKPGDPQQPTNYRGITILSIVRKLLDRVINNRLTKNVEICPEQAGFRKEHSCDDQIWMLQNMIAGARETKKPHLHRPHPHQESLRPRVARTSRHQDARPGQDRRQDTAYHLRHAEELKGRHPLRRRALRTI